MKPEVAQTTAEPAAKGRINASERSGVSFSIDSSLHSDAPKKRSSVSKRGSSGRSSFLTRMGVSFKRYVSVL